jgi:hypothetical protein
MSELSETRSRHEANVATPDYCQVSHAILPRRTASSDMADDGGAALILR